MLIDPLKASPSLRKQFIIFSKHFTKLIEANLLKK